MLPVDQALATQIPPINLEKIECNEARIATPE
jgi:hypothetical protein